MKYDNFNFIYLSEILNLPIYDASNNKKIGRIVDLASTTSQVYPRVTGILANIRHRKEPVYIPWSIVRVAAMQERVSVDHTAAVSPWN